MSRLIASLGLALGRMCRAVVPPRRITRLRKTAETGAATASHAVTLPVPNVSQQGRAERVNQPIGLELGQVFQPQSLTCSLTGPFWTTAGLEAYLLARRPSFVTSSGPAGSLQPEQPTLPVADAVTGKVSDLAAEVQPNGVASAAPDVRADASAAEQQLQALRAQTLGATSAVDALLDVTSILHGPAPVAENAPLCSDHPYAGRRASLNSGLQRIHVLNRPARNHTPVKRLDRPLPGGRYGYRDGSLGPAAGALSGAPVAIAHWQNPDMPARFSRTSTGEAWRAARVE